MSMSKKFTDFFRNYLFNNTSNNSISIDFYKIKYSKCNVNLYLIILF